MDPILGPQTAADSLNARQLAREENMVLLGHERARRRDLDARKRGEQTRAEVLTFEHLLPGVVAHLQAQVDHFTALSGCGGLPKWYPYLKGLDLNEVGAAALRGTFACALARKPRTKTLRQLSMALEIVWAHSGLKEAAKTKAQKSAIRALTKARTTPKARAKAILEAYAAIEDRYTWAGDESLQLQTGAPLLSAALSTGLFETQAVPATKRGSSQTLVVLSADGEKLLEEVDGLHLLARPILRPMLTSPAPWATLQTGAYRSDVVRSHVSLVRSPDASHKALLARGAKDGSLQPALDAVSAIQAVPLRINRDVLALREWAWEAGVALGDVFPLRVKVAVPEVPADIAEWSKRASNRFWASRAHAGRVNGGIAPNVLAFAGTTQEARELAEEDRFFLPHSLDFRGRVYPVPSFSHQAGDATKALFSFAHGQPLGPYGLVWLKVHVATCGDFSKVSKRPFEDRVAWVDDNMALVTATALAPQVNLHWTKADKPFAFYAACLDLHRALTDPAGPEAYVSHLPVALDGSNSGVQHYSAAMRAEEGALVNLTRTEAPMDLYQAVATRVGDRAARAKFLVTQRLHSLGRTYPTREELLGLLAALAGIVEDIETEARDLELRPKRPQALIVLRAKSRMKTICALLWAEEGVARSTVKRSVMTFGYSSVAYGMAQQIRTDYMEPLALEVLKGALPSHPFGADEGKAAAGWMGRQIYRETVRVLPRVAAAMRWLQTTAGVLAHEGKGVLAVTPDGFPMLMKESEWDTKQVELHLLDKTVSLRETTAHDVVIGDSVLRRISCTIRSGATQTVLKAKQQSGVAPNVIHAMDACHLRMVVLRMMDLEIPDLLVIHDSFATHAGSVGTLSVVLREQMVTLYEQYCPLTDIRDRALKALSPEGALKVPTVPEKGTLDLSEIEEAIFAFS